MTTALQALYRSDFGMVKENVASGIKLRGVDAGLLTGMGTQGGGVQGGVSLPTGYSLSGEVSLESADAQRIAGPQASVEDKDSTC